MALVANELSRELEAIRVKRKAAQEALSDLQAKRGARHVEYVHCSLGPRKGRTQRGAGSFSWSSPFAQGSCRTKKCRRLGVELWTKVNQSATKPYRI